MSRDSAHYGYCHIFRRCRASDLVYALRYFRHSSTTKMMSPCTWSGLNLKHSIVTNHEPHSYRNGYYLPDGQKAIRPSLYLARLAFVGTNHLLENSITDVNSRLDFRRLNELSLCTTAPVGSTVRNSLMYENGTDLTHATEIGNHGGICKAP